MLRALFPSNSVFFPQRLLAHYTTCLPFEERVNYLLMVRVFTECDGWWGGRVEEWGYMVLK